MRKSAEDDPEEKARWAMETMIEHCGTEDGSAILGGVVGWSPIDLRLVQYASKRLSALCADYF